MKLIANMRLSHDGKIYDEGQEFEVADDRATMILADKRNLARKAKEESAKKGTKAKK